MKKSPNEISNIKKKFRYSKSLAFPYNDKQRLEKEILEDSKNMINRRKLSNSIKSFSNKEKKNENHLLIIHKINIKEKKNELFI